MRRWSATRHLPVVVVISAISIFAASPAIASANRIRSEGEVFRYADGSRPGRRPAGLRLVADARASVHRESSRIRILVPRATPVTRVSCISCSNGCFRR